MRDSAAKPYEGGAGYSRIPLVGRVEAYFMAPGTRSFALEAECDGPFEGVGLALARDAVLFSHANAESGVMVQVGGVAGVSDAVVVDVSFEGPRVELVVWASANAGELVVGHPEGRFNQACGQQGRVLDFLTHRIQGGSGTYEITASMAGAPFHVVGSVGSYVRAV